MTDIALPRGWVEGADALKLWRRPQTWDDVLEHAQKVLDVAAREGGFSQRWVLFSGGNDSIVLLHAIVNELRWPITGVLHVNTQTGAEDDDGRFVTSDFAKELVEGWGLPFVQAVPPESFEEVFIDQKIIDGLPGPGMHMIAYARLKERAIEAHVAAVKRNHWDRIILPTGVRKDESTRRMGYGDRLVNRRGAQVWCNPLYYATKPMMVEYRNRHDLPQNPVYEHMHMSGECFCGSFASPGELDEIAFFFPRTAARIRRWEQKAKAAGCTYWTWGTKRPDHSAIAEGLAAGLITEADLWPAADLCGSCVRRSELAEKARGVQSLWDDEVGA